MSHESENRQQYYEDAKLKARKTNIADYLMNTGVKLRRVGNWYTLEEHDSYRIQGNKWYRNSQDKGGNAIDFLVEHYGISPKEAIEKLTAVDLSHLEISAKKPKISSSDGVKKKNKNDERAFDDLLESKIFDINDLTLNKNQRRVIAYLTKHRGIAPAVVLDEVKSKNLFQEVQHHTDQQTGKSKEIHNAIFPIKDENGAIIGAEAVGTLSYDDYRFKSIKIGSRAGYGYSTGQRQDPRYILFFESAVDLLSFITIKQAEEKTLAGCMLVSMAGLKVGVVENTLESFGKSAQPVFCVDNDIAGADFIKTNIEEFPNAIVRQPDKAYKDWNDMLVDKKIDT